MSFSASGSRGRARLLAAAQARPGHLRLGWSGGAWPGGGGRAWAPAWLSLLQRGAPWRLPSQEEQYGRRYAALMAPYCRPLRQRLAAALLGHTASAYCPGVPWPLVAKSAREEGWPGGRGCDWTDSEVDGLAALLEPMLAVDAAERPSAGGLLAHAWLLQREEP